MKATLIMKRSGFQITVLFALRYNLKILIKATVSCKKYSPQVLWQHQMKARNMRGCHLSKVTHQANSRPRKENTVASFGVAICSQS